MYVFSRGEHPIMVFDRDGNFLRSWGEGVFPRAHGITIGITVAEANHPLRFFESREE